MKEGYGKLPHRPFRHIPMHIVYRLKGSLPQSVIDQLRSQQTELRLQYAPTVQGRALAAEAFEEKLDSALHARSNGPYHLADPSIAKLILNSWTFIAEQLGVLVYTVCVMSNHVHVVARSASGLDIDAGLVMGKHKSFTASSANKILGRVGKSFWEVSYFDRDIREGTFDTVMWYVLNNPVTCGLVTHWEEWPYTYLHPDYADLYRRSNHP
ncbi:hypothetical protein LEM8419_02163 [Neolewinella maritima]|uniref:Transposase IS200-like domain-containing protein n=1 Tax=Neolewinella maritima TaxID=1383882 RepID=A0ABM9B2B4_9BACT|nr:transposase [Neolewinella maritima]CAH1001264.1 hypothetical protein LEM8419_02163 [Neolewinella maritima]